MEISKKQLKQIISEEMESVSNEKDELEVMLEAYVSDYEGDTETVSKESLIDFLQVLQEEKIPLAAFHAFMENMPDNTVNTILKEVVEK